MSEKLVLWSRPGNASDSWIRKKSKSKHSGPVLISENTEDLEVVQKHFKTVHECDILVFSGPGSVYVEVGPSGFVKHASKLKNAISERKRRAILGVQYWDRGSVITSVIRRSKPENLLDLLNQAIEDGAIVRCVELKDE